MPDIGSRLKPSLLISLSLAIVILAMPAPGQGAAWFWNEVPAKITDGSRYGAIRVIQAARSQGRPLFGSKAKLKGIFTRWRAEIEAAAREARISEALIAAVVAVESGGNPYAVSPAGAQGLGQLMPGTARRYGVKNSFDAAQNLKATAAYLSDLNDMFRGDLVLMLAAYNAGENAVEHYKGVPPYSETRNYVPFVLSAFEIAGQFCSHPPRAARRQCQLPRKIR